MAIDMHEEGEGLLVVHLGGMMRRTDCEALSPVVQRLGAEHGPIRVLFDLRGLQGWDQHALWDDADLSAHSRSVERIAIVGDRRWERPWKDFCGSFSAAAVRFFEPDQADRARTWLNAGEGESPRSDEVAGA